MKGFKFVLALLMCSACSAHSIVATDKSPDSDWISKRSSVVSSASSMVPSEDVVELHGDELNRAVLMLRDVQATEISSASLAENFPGVSERLKGRRVFLVRAAPDDAEGSYSVFLKDGHVLVLYGHFGVCGAGVNSALLISTEQEIHSVYGGCSSAM